MDLPARLLAVHVALEGAGIHHAFGGAIALAYWTEEPRGTRDLDVNVFVPVDDADRVLAALPAGVDVPADAVGTVQRDGQVRVLWDDTPLDLFFDYAPVHAHAARNARRVPFMADEITVLGPVELAAFKAMFDRTRDWADIEAMLVAGTLDVAELHETLAAMLDGDDPRWARLDEAVRRAAS